VFTKLPDLRIPKVTCEDSLAYDADRYYNVVPIVTRDAAAAEKVPLLGRAAAAVVSPVRLAPLAHLLATAPEVPDSAFGGLVDAFGKAMGRISGDDRSFTYSRGLGQEMEALTAECNRRKVSPLPLLEGYRVYLVFNLSAPRCADNDLMQGGQLQSFNLPSGADTQAAGFAGHFNDKLRVPPLQPIQEAESTPSRLEGAATGLRSCEDPQCAAISKLY